MRLFLDTEFSKLEPGSKLISIALVDENENYFYAELTDTYELKDCSDFVKYYVLPFLKGGEYRMTRYDCSLRLSNWIESRSCPCLIASDAPSWDLPFLLPLLEPLWPENLNKTTIFPVHVASEVEEALVIKFGYDVHNALDDALVMKKAILGY